MTANNYQWFLTSIVDYNRCRTFGFYHEYTDALDAVMTNKCNMEESLYEYLVMEKIAEGIHRKFSRNIGLNGKIAIGFLVRNLIIVHC